MLFKKKVKKKRISVEEQIFEDYELDFCETCFQMTNHIDGVCQKCLKERK